MILPWPIGLLIWKIKKGYGAGLFDFDFDFDFDPYLHFDY